MKKTIVFAFAFVLGGYFEAWLDKRRAIKAEEAALNAEINAPEKPAEEKPAEKPTSGRYKWEQIYDIHEDEFGILAGYSSETLYYFADERMVRDREGNAVDDPIKMFGEAFKKEDPFAEFTDDDILYIRNEERKCDYEIVRKTHWPG